MSTRVKKWNRIEKLVMTRLGGPATWLLLASLIAAFASACGGATSKHSVPATEPSISDAVRSYTSQLCSPVQTLVQELRNQDHTLADIDATSANEDEAHQRIAAHFDALEGALVAETQTIAPPDDLRPFHDWYVAHALYLVQVQRTLVGAERQGMTPLPPPTPAQPLLDKDLGAEIVISLTRECGDAVRDLEVS